MNTIMETIFADCEKANKENKRSILAFDAKKLEFRASYNLFYLIGDADVLNETVHLNLWKSLKYSSLFFVIMFFMLVYWIYIVSGVGFIVINWLNNFDSTILLNYNIHEYIFAAWKLPNLLIAACFPMYTIIQAVIKTAKMFKNFKNNLIKFGKIAKEDS